MSKIPVRLGDYHLALLAILIGAGCLTYRYVPYYGATPLAIGVLILVNKAVFDWRRSR